MTPGADTKKCGMCQEEKNTELFAKNQTACRECDRDRQLKKRYGIDANIYDVLWRHQQGRCRICDTKTDKLVVDHCHATNKVRGLLCQNCNMALGKFGDSISTLCAAIRYLHSAREDNNEKGPAAETHES